VLKGKPEAATAPQPATKAAPEVKKFAGGPPKGSVPPWLAKHMADKAAAADKIKYTLGDADAIKRGAAVAVIASVGKLKTFTRANLRDKVCPANEKAFDAAFKSAVNAGAFIVAKK